MIIIDFSTIFFLCVFVSLWEIKRLRGTRYLTVGSSRPSENVTYQWPSNLDPIRAQKNTDFLCSTSTFCLCSMGTSVYATLGAKIVSATSSSSSFPVNRLVCNIGICTTLNVVDESRDMIEVQI